MIEDKDEKVRFFGFEQNCVFTEKKHGLPFTIIIYLELTVIARTLIRLGGDDNVNSGINLKRTRRRM